MPLRRIEVTTRADFKSGFAPADGARIYFESAGVGPAVVFIHAGVSDRRMWDPQFDYFADKFEVIRYDLRGFGKSEMPDRSYSNRADLGKVLQFLGIGKAAIVGCSMGGSTAIDFTEIVRIVAGNVVENMPTRQAINTRRRRRAAASSLTRSSPTKPLLGETIRALRESAGDLHLIYQPVDKSKRRTPHPPASSLT